MRRKLCSPSPSLGRSWCRSPLRNDTAFRGSRDWLMPERAGLARRPTGDIILPNSPIPGPHRGAMMSGSQQRIEVYLEVGQKRTFAGAVDWPGWCRSGRDEASALRALFDYGPRYARVLRAARLGFRVSGAASELVVVERLRGDATTDFGAPAAVPSKDSGPVAEEDLRRLRAILEACWRGVGAAPGGAPRKTLSKGPHGGG